MHGVFRRALRVGDELRYFVYLCELWFDGIGTNSRISTLVHEASHHAGPGDVTYDRNYMKAVPSVMVRLSGACLLVILGRSCLTLDAQRLHLRIQARCFSRRKLATSQRPL